MAGNRKQLLDTFQRNLNQNYENYCSRHGIVPSNEGLIIFLIDNDLIPPKNVKGYVVSNEFEKLQEIKNEKKTRMVELLSDKFNLSERSIWTILKNKKSKIRK